MHTWGCRERRLFAGKPKSQLPHGKRTELAKTRQPASHMTRARTGQSLKAHWPQDVREHCAMLRPPSPADTKENAGALAAMSLAIEVR